MSISTLTHPNVSANYDAEHGIAYITYSGLLTAEVSTAVYEWLSALIEEIGIDNMYGEVFDFRDVKEFMPDNLLQARRKSRGYNLRNNVKKLPIAMIVENFYQEEILRGPMQNVEENKRKRIVRKLDDALAFLHEWHAEQEDS
ncbi:MAG: hypothetical protein Q9P44_07095 [Anaerolineae bacterium]|nr:hypothetical protein [Anaerolineae bacterium]